MLNRKYLPRSKLGPHPCGASLFAVRTADVLRDRGIAIAVLLYNRVDGIAAPRLRRAGYFGCPAVQLDFCFRHDPAALKAAMTDAFDRLLGKPRHVHAARCIAYFQTDVLLPFCPDQAIPVVTHHGPFADHLIESVGLELAASAYGTPEKLAHLRRYQRDGLDWLRLRPDARALEISQVQEQFLLRQSVPKAQIFQLRPPLFEHEPTRAPRTAPELAVRDFVAAAEHELVIMTAAARLDDFKNVELVAQAASALFAAGAPVSLLVIGGGRIDVRRQRLIAALPGGLRALVLAKLRHDELMTCFAMLSRRAVFVCASRFETCGFTPLEAAMHGILTVVPNAVSAVEASGYFPVSLRFQPTLPALSAMLSCLVANPHIARETGELCRAIRERVCVRGFAEALIAHWASWSLASPGTEVAA